MIPTARHQCIVLSDSDIGVPADYLLRVAAAFEGARSRGRHLPLSRRRRFWILVQIGGARHRRAFPSEYTARLASGARQALLSARPSPYIAVGSTRSAALRLFRTLWPTTTRLGQPCAKKGSGSLFRRFSWNIAAANLHWRNCGATNCAGRAPFARWPRSDMLVRVVTHPLPFALLAFATGTPVAGSALAILAILCRIVLLHVTTRSHRRALPPYWLIPIRDLFSFAIFVWSFCGRNITWRGRNYRVRVDGTMSARIEGPKPS